MPKTCFIENLLKIQIVALCLLEKYTMIVGEMRGVGIHERYTFSAEALLSGVQRGGGGALCYALPPLRSKELKFVECDSNKQ